MTIQVDGNDGTGKSTLVAGLRALGYHAQDRGHMTLATDDDTVTPEDGSTYLLLRASPEESQERLLAAGKSLGEEYHTLESLRYYRGRFDALVSRFGALVIDTEDLSPQGTLQTAAALLEGKSLALGIPKGRLQEGVLGLLQSRGLGGVFKNREYHAAGTGLTETLLKPRAIPQMVALGMLDAGFTGRDLLMDSIYSDHLVEVMDTGRNPVRIMAAGQRPDILKNPPPRPLVVATEFANLADRWLSDMGLAHIVLHTYGSTEAYVPSFADIIIDVVETGETLKANGLSPLHDFGPSSTVLITRREMIDNPRIKALVRNLQE